MVFHRKAGTRKFKRESTTSLWFMTDSTTPLQLILTFQLQIYLLCLLIKFLDKKTARYTPYHIMATLYVYRGNSDITLVIPSDPPQYINLSYNSPSTKHTITRDKTSCTS